MILVYRSQHKIKDFDSQIELGQILSGVYDRNGTPVVSRNSVSGNSQVHPDGLGRIALEGETGKLHKRIWSPLTIFVDGNQLWVTNPEGRFWDGGLSPLQIGQLNAQAVHGSWRLNRQLADQELVPPTFQDDISGAKVSAETTWINMLVRVRDPRL